MEIGGVGGWREGVGGRGLGREAAGVRFRSYSLPVPLGLDVNVTSHSGALGRSLILSEPQLCHLKMGPIMITPIP